MAPVMQAGGEGREETQGETLEFEMKMFRCNENWSFFAVCLLPTH